MCWILNATFSCLKLQLEFDWTFRTTPSSLSKEEIVRSIEFLNANYETLNTDKFGRLQSVEIVLVIQVIFFKQFML